MTAKEIAKKIMNCQFDGSGVLFDGDTVSINGKIYNVSRESIIAELNKLAEGAK